MHEGLTHSRIGRALSTDAGRSGIFGTRKRVLWASPIALGLLVLLGLWVDRAVEQHLKDQRKAELSALLRATADGLTTWFSTQEELVSSAARDPDLQQATMSLLALADGADADALRSDPAQARLRDKLGLLLRSTHYSGFAITTPAGRVVAALRDPVVGRDATEAMRGLSDWTISETTRVWPPFVGPRRELMMAASAPILHDGRVVAALHLAFDPHREFYKLLQAARSGESGETYAFDDRGRMLSPSRFGTRLRELGLLPADADSAAGVFTLKTPGVDLTAPNVSVPDLSHAPLTEAVARATEARGPGHDVEGYPDYRGVDVIGAWTWLPAYNIGIVTEKDASEAFALRDQLRQAIGVLFLVLLLASLALLGVSHFAVRLHQRSESAEARVQRLGQYTLEQKLGEGGMGAVYIGRHEMLRRPTAIKLLKSGHDDPDALTRFEREVRITSQLTHPNTIAVYDYGRTPQGTFYYAMELLDGVDLDALVARSGPLSSARAIHVLLQLCGSLQEAHEEKLIHRDVKPANVVLCTRGGVQDTVKVLDFGLVKNLSAPAEPVSSSPSLKSTAVNAIMGTPAFVAPELVASATSVSPLSDIYSFGATAYYLVTGRLVFEKVEVMQFLLAHLNEAPVPPSEHVSTIPADLEAIILRCLAKDPAARFASMEAIADALLACADAGGWTRAMARTWWAEHGERVSQRPPTAEATASTITSAVG